MNSLSVSITVSDPWDVGEAVKWQPIRGTLLKRQATSQTSSGLIKFEAPVNYRGSCYYFAVAWPRRKEDSIAEVYAGKMVCCGITGISAQQAESDNPLDISKWRGGFAFVGDVVLSSQFEQNVAKP